jgi:peptidyl-tRNA hydrolase, PTH2 family
VSVEHKQVIALRKDLNMRKGKMVAQGAYASMPAILQLGHAEQGHSIVRLDRRIDRWLLRRFKKICIPANSEAEPLALHEAARSAARSKMPASTESGNVHTYTSVAGPDREGRVDAITGRRCGRRRSLWNGPRRDGSGVARPRCDR